MLANLLGFCGLRSRICWGKKSQIPLGKNPRCKKTTIIKRHLSHGSPNVFTDFGTIWPCKAFAFWQHVSLCQSHIVPGTNLSGPKRGFRRSPCWSREKHRKTSRDFPLSTRVSKPHNFHSKFGPRNGNRREKSISLVSD